MNVNQTFAIIYPSFVAESYKNIFRISHALLLLFIRAIHSTRILLLLFFFVQSALSVRSDRRFSSSRARARASVYYYNVCCVIFFLRIFNASALRACSPTQILLLLLLFGDTYNILKRRRFHGEEKDETVR